MARPIPGMPGDDGDSGGTFPDQIHPPLFIDINGNGDPIQPPPPVLDAGTGQYDPNTVIAPGSIGSTDAPPIGAVAANQPAPAASPLDGILAFLGQPVIGGIPLWVLLLAGGIAIGVWYTWPSKKGGRR